MFFQFLGLVVILVSVFAIFGPEGKKINLKEISFKTTNSSQLYFKNIRSYFYNKEEIKAANFNLFRLKSNGDKLNFVIVNNWLMSESYIVLESDLINYSINWQFENDSGAVTLSGENNRAHYVFAAELFEQLDRNATLALKTQNYSHRLSEDEMASLKTTLKDYFKLVGKLR